MKRITKWMAATLMTAAIVISLLSLWGTQTAYAAKNSTTLTSGTFHSMPWSITSDGQLLLGKENQAFVFNNITGYYGDGEKPDLDKVDVATLDVNKLSFDLNWPWQNNPGAGNVEIKKVDVLGTIRCRGSFQKMFKDLKCSEMDLAGLVSDDVMKTDYMFANCDQLKALDLRMLDTGNVRSMAFMFNEDAQLTSLDVSGFATANATSMQWMFKGCKNLKTVNVSGFATGKVESMEAMFLECENLKTVDVSGFDTSHVINFTDMFHGCGALEKLDVSNFATSKAEAMGRMFFACASLKELDVSHFDTRRVGVKDSHLSDASFGMSMMFSDCKKLEKLNLSSFDMTGCSLGSMLYGLEGLKEIKLGVNTRFAETQFDRFDDGKRNYQWQRSGSGSVYTSTRLMEAYDSNSTAMAGVYKRVEAYDSNSTAMAETYKPVKQDPCALGDHDYKEVITKSTLSKDGKIVYRCSRCGDVKKGTKVIYHPTRFKLTTSFTYNGKSKKPTVTVLDSSGAKIGYTQYSVVYANNKNVGKATATIRFSGKHYSGTKKLSFTINPAGTTVLKVTAAKKGFTVKWKKKAAQTTGYQIQYSTTSKFKSGNKTQTITKNKTVSRKVTRLKAKKKYYVRVRTYKKAGSKKYYSKWSKAKAVTTKK